MTSVTIQKLGGDQSMLQLLPLILASLGLICSITGILLVKLFFHKYHQTLLFKSLNILNILQVKKEMVRTS